MIDDYVYLIIKANIPGDKKQIFFSYFLTKFFKNYINNTFKILDSKYYDTADGPYYIMKINSSDYLYIKTKMIDIENDHSLGRFIDIDVYHNKTVSISRKELKISSRKCYICNNDAFICSRNKTHNIFEIFAQIEKCILNYIIEDFYNIIFESITLEAKLHPKFGLVTEKSKGSHPDMDYSLMVEAKHAICDYLTVMVILGYIYDLDTAYKEAKEVGIYAEENMLSKTEGVNCYKGLIFVLGLACVSCGYVIRHNLPASKIYDCVAFMTRDIMLDFAVGEETFGKIAFKDYGFTGIRGEVNHGLQSVQKAINVLNRYETFSDEALTMTLINIVSNIEDTVLLKRAGSIEKYQYFKDKISSINSYELSLIEEITKEAIRENISIGGAADLLVVTIFIKKVMKRYLD